MEDAKHIALRALTGAFIDRDPSVVERYFAPDYIQHNPVIPSGHASGRVEAAVSQKDRIGIDLDRRIAPRQLIAEGPMRHGAATI